MSFSSQSRVTMKVVVGTNNLIVGGDRYSVETIIIHEQYDSNLINHDVSVVKVDEDINFGPKVQPIGLPEENTGAGADLVLSGWGRLSVSFFLNTYLLK